MPPKPDQKPVDAFERQCHLEDRLTLHAKELIIQKHVRERAQGELGVREALGLLKEAQPRLAQALADEVGARRSGKLTELDHICNDLGADDVACIALNILVRAAALAQRSYQDVGCEIGEVLRRETLLRKHDMRVPRRRSGKSKGTAIERQDVGVSTTRERLRKDWEKLEVDAKEQFLQTGARVIELAIAATGLFKTEPRGADPLKGGGSSFEQRPNIVLLSDRAERHREGIIRHECMMAMGDQMPMLIPPRPWLSVDRGGYLRFEVGAIKERGRSSLHRKTAKLLNTDPPRLALDALSHLQQTAWRIDTRILDAMRTALKRGGAKARLASVLQRERVDALRRIIGEAEAILENIGNASFYYVWQYCFRGRAYPRGSLLTPQGRDAARALLRFDERRPLGENGRKWLAIYGGGILEGAKPKGNSFSARIDWIEQNSERICRAAESPFGSDMALWAGARTFSDKFSKEAWQGLQFCFEWADMIAQGDAFRSSLPIAVDGTCNAVQHFAALTRDSAISQKVNLAPAAAPTDIYATVAERVLAENAKDESLTWLFQVLGYSKLEDLVDRRICKTPVMTLPYGAQGLSRVRALREELRERSEVARKIIETRGHPDGERFRKAIVSLEKAIRVAAEKELQPAVRAMAWLKRIADSVSNDQRPVAWKTPAGFQVWQIYEKEKGVRVKIKLRTIKNRAILQPKMQRSTGELDLGRAKRSISANFVHSLDGAHMKLVTLAAKDAGITSLRMVHDSFATHADVMETFRGFVRDTFVTMYQKNDPFQALLDAAGPWKKSPPALPERGDFDIEATLQSDYFFS